MRTKNIVINGIKYYGPPAQAICALERESAKCIEIAELVCWLFDVTLGSRPDPILCNRTFRLGDVTRLPRRLQNHAKNYVRWIIRDSLLIGEVITAKYKVIAHIVRLRKKSEFGKRRRRIVKTLQRERVPQQDEAESSEELTSVDILTDEIACPLSPRTLRKIRAFNPRQIQILDAGARYRMVTLKGTVTIRLMRDGYSISSVTIALPVEEPPPPAQVIHGKLLDFFETGTEGVIWAIVDDDGEGYSGLHCIDDGDHLTIIALNGDVLWNGGISCDRKSGFQNYPQNPEYGQPQALGRWIHWTQRGFNPDVWARFFIREEGQQLRGILRKRRDIPRKAKA
ncbi:hypothetical protein CMV30_15050 [Nibricoccus aquaticus]|uniref:Uncharacterized protein n=1 Tax=Nibricoccus aquaticus TaxID=2576891 RepID=A0A290Q9H1_9BACT|nr:hypothetical protein [Nibricoccus aquaticus]ATC65164.1 hypothetical protein CMV30_15050 [Nibricoccus aquaticus]